MAFGLAPLRDFCTELVSSCSFARCHHDKRRGAVFGTGDQEGDLYSWASRKLWLLVAAIQGALITACGFGHEWELALAILSKPIPADTVAVARQHELPELWERKTTHGGDSQPTFSRLRRIVMCLETSTDRRRSRVLNCSHTRVSVAGLAGEQLPFCLCPSSTLE